jgi:hypothetical protein
MKIFLVTAHYTRNEYCDTTKNHGVFSSNEKAVKALRKVEEHYKEDRHTRYESFVYAEIDERELDSFVFED